MADALLEPTRIYAKPVRLLTATVDVRAMAHVTGGGIPGNLARAAVRPGWASRSTSLAGSGRRCSRGWPRWAWRRRRCGASSTSGSGTPRWSRSETADLALATLEKAGETAWLAGHVVEGDGVTLPLRVGVLISGTGTNLQALIDDGGIEIACVVSNGADAAGLARAAAGRHPESLAAADERETADFLEQHGVGLVVLAGYMRILSPEFVHRFSGRIMNVHPSLLPAFPGAHAVRDALAARRAGDRRDGAPGGRRARRGRQRADRSAGGARPSRMMIAPRT